MAATQLGAALRDLRRMATAKDARALSDRQLLERFAESREESAFEALVRRHGPLVMGVCRRVLHNLHDAEDVFQATFLVLARRSGSVGRRSSLGTWLHQVAFHMALKARKQSSNRRKREEKVGAEGAAMSPPDAGDPMVELCGRELLAAFDEELLHLPETYKAPLVLCYLEGKTRDEAARQLGCSESTLKRRLDQGKAKMQMRLAQRGVALPAALIAAGLGQATVPAALAASTIRAGLLVASGTAAVGAASARVIGLMKGALGGMAMAKMKSVSALLLAVGLLGAGLLGYGAPVAQQPEPPAQAAPKAASSKPRPAAADDKKEMIVSGRVLDADGKPMAGAPVAVVGEPPGGNSFSDGMRVLGVGKADGEGRFRLAVVRTSSQTFDALFVLASGAGHGVGLRHLNPDAARPSAEIRLSREQVIRGRLVDLQGQPAVGVIVRPDYIGKPEPGESKGVFFRGKPEELPVWPKPSTTDAEGRFVVHGVGQGFSSGFAIREDRFATQALHVLTDGKGPIKEVNASLAPAHIIEGVVRYGDTGKPVANARLMVYAGGERGMTGLRGRTDAQGRFKINPWPGDNIEISAFPPEGEPYLTLKKTFQWPKAAVKQEVELNLIRVTKGSVVRGMISEAGSGKPVAKASVQFMPREVNNPNLRSDILTGWQNIVTSRADGKFELTVPPGPGHLLVHGPTSDFILEERGHSQLAYDRPGGIRYYAHAFLPVDLKPGDAHHEITAKLKRGVTVKGRVVGPDDKPIAEAMQLSRLRIFESSPFWRGHPVPVRDGRFELRGLDPAKSYPVYFLDAKNKLGATVELSGKQADQEVTVKLLPCGEARARYLDGNGKPRVAFDVCPDIVMTPGCWYHNDPGALRGELQADKELVVNVDRRNYWSDKNKVRTDAEGWITFPALIPGATYRVGRYAAKGWLPYKEFKVGPAETIELGDIKLQD